MAERRSGNQNSFAAKVCTSVVIGAAGVALLFLLWSASNVLLLAFAAILFSIFLHGLSAWLAKHTRLPARWALATTVMALCVIVGLGAWLLAPRIFAQADQLSKGLTQSIQEFGSMLRQYDWGERLLAQAPGFAELTKRTNLLSQVTGLFSTTLGVVANTVIVAFIGLYLAVNPGTYTRGALSLLPKRWHPRMNQVLDETGARLESWLMGRFLLMGINAALTTLGLWLLGIPLALTLGIIAGVLNFIPNIGPIIAAVPAVLIGWTHGPMTALYVGLLYLFLQNLDGYVLTPLVQQRTASLPPALIIFAQLLFGVLAGGLGLLLAAPLMAATMIFVKRLYVEDALGEREAAPKNGA